ncbi:putative Kinase-like protein [Seiridium unicorne]|uniref:Kinase-like protein n=1 Tax=Seiridium unicorne TaxID=138068 RepID=A0ABR2UYS0_9PEZI
MGFSDSIDQGTLGDVAPGRPGLITTFIVPLPAGPEPPYCSKSMPDGVQRHIISNHIAHGQNLADSENTGSSIDRSEPSGIIQDQTDDANYPPSRQGRDSLTSASSISAGDQPEYWEETGGTDSWTINDSSKVQRGNIEHYVSGSEDSGTTHDDIDKAKQTEPHVPHGIYYQTPSKRSAFQQRRGSVTDRPGSKPYQRHRSYLDINSPSEKSQCSLEEDLWKIREPEDPEDKGFFPQRALRKLVNISRVSAELRLVLERVKDATINTYAQIICSCTDENKSFLKIFVILVMIRRTKTIIDFIQHDIHDSYLPLQKCRRRKDPKLFDLITSESSDQKNASLAFLKASKYWGIIQLDGFYEWQWATLAPFFEKPGSKKYPSHYSFQNKTTLPFINDARRNPKGSYRTGEFTGGFSQVFKVAIHEEHHDFDCKQVSDQNFAVKHLKSQEKKNFERELEMLKAFSNRHSHLISLLASYEKPNDYFYIFHWADANLMAYWQHTNPNPSFDWSMVKWVAEQCKGLASGILLIHEHKLSIAVQTASDLPPDQTEVFGYHGDIKPQNVLWFRSAGQDDLPLGTLKLTDFGTARFRHNTTYSMKSISMLAVSQDYRAPECDLSGSKSIGRGYDIWSLGCLYLEFITWLLGGRVLLEQFAFVRMAEDPLFISTKTFFQIETEKTKANGKPRPRARIKVAVIKFIGSLHGHQECSHFLHNFLDLIQHGMLKINDHKSKTSERLPSRAVHDELDEMFQRCRDDQQYACAPISQLDAACKDMVTNNHSKYLTARSPGGRRGKELLNQIREDSEIDVR